MFQSVLYYLLIIYIQQLLGKHEIIGPQPHEHSRSLLTPRPASEYSSPSGRPLSCVVDENTPVMTPVNGAVASGPPGEQRIQERRVRSQRHRNYMSRTHLHTPPDLPEGYGETRTHSNTPTITLHGWLSVQNKASKSRGGVLDPVILQVADHNISKPCCNYSFLNMSEFVGCSRAVLCVYLRYLWGEVPDVTSKI